ncbi:conserved hypothetical integral membrane protein [Sphingomonas sp. YR710]|uniref:YeiH family protein n=1 Tax=Sphingomonas sp. YR710 TaxID=1882773 RepID=UPI00088E3299|nr:putative sulfate exporter family transporter [Sphingomonas sp. YR710]SDD03009.1 conserved hypothetical integral membrane protein [Sphingomonas sp. YR710]
MTIQQRPMAADLYGDLIPSAPRKWRDYPAGLAVICAATLAAGYLTDRYGAPLTLMALLIGLALNFLSTDQRLSAGLSVASGPALRLGIVLLGARVTLEQIADLGPTALIAVMCIVTVTICSGVVVARMAGAGAAFGVLAGASVAICGASAALAVAAVLGQRRIDRAQLASVLVGIAALSATAMFTYPIIAHMIDLNDRQAGFLFGAAIHDVAQAIGAGYSFSPPAGETAAIVKLTRVALLAPVLTIVSLAFPRDAHGPRAIRFPLFVLGFFAMAGVNSFGLVPSGVAHYLNSSATALLAGAVAATGIRAPMAALRGGGLRPILIIVVPTLAALLLAVTVAHLLI